MLAKLLIKEPDGKGVAKVYEERLRTKMKTAFLLLLIMSWSSTTASALPLSERIQQYCPDCNERTGAQTGAYILEKGEESLISRAWLAANAVDTIDVQYFIWSTDNIGILAAEALLSAAERGVKVRVLVDDLLVDAESTTLLILASHPNVSIKIYNPVHSVGVSFWQRVKNLATNFHGANQRMHDKAAIFDGFIGITGGRNMADEYFDYDHEYNFRDRDILLVGHAVKDMSENFNEFWASSLAVDVAELLDDPIAPIDSARVEKHVKMLHEYAKDENNFSPHVHQLLQNLPRHFSALFDAMQWGDVQYISDVPGKNSGDEFLAGGGESTSLLVEQMKAAKSSILIQSPYLVFPEEGMAFLQALLDRGVSIKISTNSLASTDNLMAYSGYIKQRDKLLKMGVELYEFKPQPAIQQELVLRYPALAENNPIFAVHAKSMVIDDRVIYIGTFNLDPRSANLNTEVGVLFNNGILAGQLRESILQDMHPENSWHVTEQNKPDVDVPFMKKVELWFYRVLPIGRLL